MSASLFSKTVPTSEAGRPMLALAAMAAATFFWAVLENFGAFLPKGYAPIQTVWSRYLVHLIFMIIVFSPRKGFDLVKTGCLGLQISRAMLMVAMPACFIVGKELLPIRAVWLLSWSSVVILLVMGLILLGETVSLWQWIAAGLCWIGVWVMSGADLPPLSWRYLLPIGMGFSFALYVTLTRRMSGESTNTKLFHTALWVFLAVSLVVPFQWTMPSLKAIIVYICIGLSGYLGLFFLDKSIELAPVSLTAPLICTVPVWSCLQLFILTRRTPGWSAITGALLISTSSAFIAWAVWSGRVQFGNADI